MTALLLLREIARTRKELLAIKAQPVSEIHAVNALSGKLTNVFDEVSAGVLRELTSRSFIGNEITRRAILQPFESSIDDLARLTTDDALLAAQRGRNKVINDLLQRGVSTQFDAMPQTIADRVAQSTFQASRNTMKRLVGDVKIALEQGLSEGLGVSDIAKLLEDQFVGMRDFELKRLARTEVQSFQNVGAQQTMHDLGISFEQWLTAEDDRVRETHADLHGEITALDQPFSNGLKHPLDPDGPSEEWMNCRCRIVPFIIAPDKAAPNSGPFFEDELVVVKSVVIGGFNAFFAKKEFERVRDERGRFAFVGGSGEQANDAFASAAEITEARAMAREKIKNAPVPSEEKVQQAREELARAAAGEGRPGGDSRGGSAEDRRKQRVNLYKEFGGEEKGYVVDPDTGLKMHWADPNYTGTKYDPAVENPNGYPAFERGKIFVKSQGGGYQLPNLLPESFESNRTRGAKPLRTENL